MNRRLVMLAVDGLDRTIVKEWVAEGRLPVLQSLMSESRTLVLDIANRPLSGAIWSDTASGVSAATHGFFHQQQLRVGSYESHEIDAARVARAADPFYKTLSAAGVRCAVVDFPIDHPISGFNGVQVVDWGTEFKRWRFETRPKSFALELISTYGDHPLNNYTGTRNDLPGLLKLKDGMLRGIELKGRFAIDLIKQRAHDFIFFNFSEIHKAGHFLWRFHDRKHFEFTDSEPALVDSLRDTYEELDRTLGRVIAELDENDDLILFTDRGMCANHRGDHLVDEILLRLQLAAPLGKQPASSPLRSLHGRLFSSQRARTACRLAAHKLLPHSVRNALLPFHRAAVGAAPPADMKRSRVFRLPTVGDSHLRVNLAGREPDGIVTPGAQYDELLAEIATKYRALINPETGAAAVDGVYFPVKQFPGPRSAELPDVAVVWSIEAPINTVTSDDVGAVTGRQYDARSGNHRPDGFALFRGPSFVAGSGEYEGDARQIAPAILRYFGVARPEHYEMDAPAEIIAA